MKKLFQKFKSHKINLMAPVLLDFISIKLNITLPRKVQLWSSFVATNTYANAKAISDEVYSLQKDEPLQTQTEGSKHFFSRHLPPNTAASFDEKNLDELTDLFCRDKGQFNEGQSNLLFMYFAQWFTDGFFRSSLLNPRKTGSNHNVDLCQIYGLDKQTTDALREDSNGYLKSQGNKGEEIPPTLFHKTNSVYKVKKEFSNVSYLRELDHSQIADDKTSKADNELELIVERLTGVRSKNALKAAVEKLAPTILATGLERGNATIGNLSLNALFLRSHNRICDDLCKISPFIEIKDQKQKNDEIFQLARDINTVLLIKLTIEEYINHIAGRNLFKFDPGCANNQSWNKKSWLAAEFNLLYRWHGLVPNNVEITDTKTVSHRETPFKHIAENGLSTILESACEQAAGRIQAGNTPPFLRNAEKQLIKLGREWQLQSYNKYRQAFGLKPFKSISQLTSSKRLQTKLQQIYGHIDNVEFVVGLYAEDPYNSQIVGELQSQMVAYDAFTFLYSSPILQDEKYTKLMANPVAKQWIENINSIDNFVSKIHSSKPLGKFHFRNALKRNKPTLKPIKKGSDLRGTHENTLCPHLRIGLRTSNLTPDENGWVDAGQFHSFFERVGIKPNSLLASQLTKAGQRFSPFNPLNKIKISAFKNTFMDHGSSTGILNSNEKLDSSRLDVFKKHAIKVSNSTELRLYKKQFELITDELHNNPREFKAGFAGQLLQLCEFKLLTEIYGRVDSQTQKKYLNYDDIISIWKYACPPDGWEYATKPKIGVGWSLLTLCDSSWHLVKRKTSTLLKGKQG